MMHKVGIYTRSPFSRSGMKQIVQGQDIMEFDNLSEARAAAATFRLLVLVVVESDILGEDSTERINDARLRLVVVAPTFKLDRMTALFVRGARGYQLETVSPAVMSATLQMVALGELGLPSSLVDCFASAPKNNETSPLSTREIGVVQRLAQGDCNKEIARVIGVTEATTKVHVKAIMRKLGVANRTQAAVWAVRNGHDRPALPP